MPLKSFDNHNIITTKWSKTKSCKFYVTYYTVVFPHIATHYIMISHVVLWWLWQILNQNLSSQKKPRTSPSRACCGLCLVRNLEKIYPNITAPKCILNKNFYIEPEFTVWITSCPVGTGDKGIEGLKQHSFFSNINWEKLMARRLNPPFKPAVTRVDDAFYFDTEFTSKTPRGRMVRWIGAFMQ